MNQRASGNSRLLLRVIFYLLVIAILLIVRGGGNWRHLTRLLPRYAEPDTTLTLAGLDLAPELISKLAVLYEREYPPVSIRLQGGGTNQALESLINGRADVAFLIHRPTAGEQQLFRSVDHDTATWYPVALGGIVLLANPRSEIGPLTVEDLRGFVGGRPVAGWEILYAPDPNSGLWDAFLERLRIPREARPDSSRVTFLRDSAGVMAAVEADDRALGLASTLAPAPGRATSAGDLRPGPVAIGPAAGGEPVMFSIENLAAGTYPLWHHVHVCCRASGSAQAAKFVTYVTSDRGQRQIEREGFLPSRRVLRNVHLTREPVGN